MDNLDLKPKKNKVVNILLRILIVIIAVVGLSSTIICFIPKSYSVNLHDANITAAKIYKNGAEQSIVYKADNEDKFNEIYNAYKKTLKTTVMEALMSGKLNTKEEIKYNYQYSVYTNLASSTTKSYIMFDYAETQKVVYRGSEFDDPNYAAVKIETYNQVLIEVSDSSSLEEFAIYYVNSAKNSSYKVTLPGIQHSLYEYISDFEI